MRRMNRKDDEYEIEGIRGSRTKGKYERQNKGLNAKVNVLGAAERTRSRSRSGGESQRADISPE